MSKDIKQTRFYTIIPNFIVVSNDQITFVIIDAILIGVFWITI